MEIKASTSTRWEKEREENDKESNENKKYRCTDVEPNEEKNKCE